jgi:hypothetical protein
MIFVNEGHTLKYFGETEFGSRVSYNLNIFVYEAEIKLCQRSNRGSVK